MPRRTYGLRDKVAGVAQNKLIRARVIEILGNTVSVRLTQNASRIYGIRLIGGPVQVGDLVHIDYISGTPVAQAIGTSPTTSLPDNTIPRDASVAEVQYASDYDVPEHTHDITDIENYASGTQLYFRNEHHTTGNADDYVLNLIYDDPKDDSTKYITTQYTFIDSWRTFLSYDVIYVPSGFFTVHFHGVADGTPYGGGAATSNWLRVYAKLYLVEQYDTTPGSGILLGTTGTSLILADVELDFDIVGTIVDPLILSGVECLRVEMWCEEIDNGFGPQNCIIYYEGDTLTSLTLPPQAGGGAGGHVIYTSGSPLVQRYVLDFEGDVEVYDDDENNWTVVNIEYPEHYINDLLDATVSSPSQDEMLVYDSGQWVNSPPPDGFIEELDDIGDVNVPSPGVGHALLWSGTQWTSGSVAGGEGVGLKYRIYLYDESAEQVYSWPPTYSNLTSALGMSAAGDILIWPNVTITGNITVPDGVYIIGLSRELSILEGQVTIGNNSGIENMSIVVTDSTSGTLKGIVTVASKTFYVYDCNVEITQNGSGDARAVSCEHDTCAVHVWNSTLYAKAATSGNGFAVWKSPVCSASCYIFGGRAIGQSTPFSE